MYNPYLAEFVTDDESLKEIRQRAINNSRRFARRRNIVWVVAAYVLGLATAVALLFATS